MAINKVVYGNQTLIDLTDSTLTTSDELVEGVTAYDRSGNRITGTADYMDKVDNPTADKILIDDGNGQAIDSSVLISNVATQSDLSDYVAKSGDTMTGPLIVSNSNLSVKTGTIDLTTTPSSNIWGRSIYFTDTNDTYICAMQPVYYTNGAVSFYMSARKTINGTAYNNGLALQVLNDGTPKITLYGNNTAAAWRSAIGAQATLTAGNGIVISGNTIINRFSNLTNVDLNTIRYNCQAYVGDSCTNKPTTNGGMLICTMGSNDGAYGAQLFITYSTTNQGVYYRRFNGSATPTAWVKLEDEITSTSGTVTMNTSNLIASASVIKEGGWVYVSINKTGTTQFTANTTQAVGTLPEGFRPSSLRNGMALMTLNGIPTYWTITSGGVLSLRVATAPATNTATYMTFSFPL